MKTTTKLIATAAIAGAIFFAGNVKAQTTPVNAFRFGIGIEPGIPTGDETPRSNFELGGTARLQYGVSKNFALTLTSGFYDFFGKERPNSTDKYPDHHIIPAKVGVKAFFSPNIYFGAEAGPGFSLNNGNTKLILAPALGYANQTWDVGVRYENFSGGPLTVNGVTTTSNYGMVALRVAYGFGL